MAGPKRGVSMTRTPWRNAAVLLLSVGGVVARGQAGAGDWPGPEDGATLDQYLERAFRENPGLKGVRQEWQAAVERATQAGALDDPQLSFEQFVEQKDVRWQVALTQAIPLFGRRGLMKKEAAAEAEAASHEFEAARLDLYDRVSRAFYDYHLQGRSLAALEEHERLLADLEHVTRARYEAGTARFADVTKAQVERERTASEAAALRDERRVRSDQLAALLDLTVNGPLPWPKTSPSAPALPDDAVLFGLIDDLNPELKAAQALIEKNRYTEKLARRVGLPDLMLGAGVMSMPGMEGGGDEYDASLMVGITLPWWRGKNAARRREAAALAESARNRKADQRNALTVELRRAIVMHRDAARRVALFRDSLIPKAEQTYEVVRQDFVAGRTDFMDVVDAQRTLLDFRLSYERALVDLELAVVEIGCCIGKYGAELQKTLGTPARTGP